MIYNKWLDTLVDEKGIDREEEIIVEGKSGVVNFMTVETVIEAIKATGKVEQQKIKDTLVLIDFKNGDITHYFRHLAQALAI